MFIKDLGLLCKTFQHLLTFIWHKLQNWQLPDTHTDSLRVLNLCGFRNPQNHIFRMFAKSHMFWVWPCWCPGVLWPVWHEEAGVPLSRRPGWDHAGDGVQADRGGAHHLAGRDRRGRIGGDRDRWILPALRDLPCWGSWHGDNEKGTQGCLQVRPKKNERKKCAKI